MRIPARYSVGLLWLALAAALCVGILARGYWTPDEPREADLAWRMSWQPSKAVPLLAGEPFCEKPPLTYWAAGAAMAVGGRDAWVARLPNLLYALITALAVGAIGRRAAGPVAGLVAAAAVSTFLLSYQVAIWLATDAPLLASVAAALLGLHTGFYADDRGGRLRGYSGMHLALAAGFLSKSAAAWMVPALALLTLVIWERRWRELLRWELYVGLLLQAAVVLGWVWVVYVGPEGPARLKVFFWNNLVGRFAHVDAPEQLQYAAAHRNSPGKYLLELPVYLWPWTLLVAAAARQAWRLRFQSTDGQRCVRFAVASFAPALAVLSVAATARNIYLAPALPGLAILLGWWGRGIGVRQDPWDCRAIRATSLLLAIAALALAAALAVVAADSWASMDGHLRFAAVSAIGLAAAAAAAMTAWRAAARGRFEWALLALLLAYAAELSGPASQIYGRVDTWQDLASIGRSLGRDAAGRPVILFAPDETTRAFVDMYAGVAVGQIPGPVGAGSTARLRAQLASTPGSWIMTQLPGRAISPRLASLAAHLGIKGMDRRTIDQEQTPDWASALGLRVARRYELPNGRRYALLERAPAAVSR